MKIAMVGDIALFGKYSVENDKIFDYFEDVSKYLKAYDYVIGNLETPLIDNWKTFGNKSVHLHSNEENVEILKYLNIDAVNLSNNHIFDCGIDGYEKTKLVLESNSIKYFGIEKKYIDIHHVDSKVSISGYCCYSTNALGYNDSKNNTGIDVLNPQEIEERIIFNHKRGYLSLLSLHFGQEHINYPNYDHVMMARKLSSKAPCILYGHHPHVMQGIENVDKSLIAYSLGNFCFDHIYKNYTKELIVKQKTQQKTSFILEVEIKNNIIEGYRTIPLYADDDKMVVGNNQTIEKKIKDYSEMLQKNTVEYCNHRNIGMQTLSKERNGKRDINWYKRRLNFNTFMIIINSLKNKHKYNKTIKKYIK